MVNEYLGRKYKKKYGENFEWKSHSGFPKPEITREDYKRFLKEGSSRKEILDSFIVVEK